MITNEEWRDVPGYEGKYRVSNLGNVFSVKKNSIITGTVSRKGYREIQLWLDGTYKGFRVHNLVLLAFIGPRPADCPETRHLNSNPLDNQLSNLAYGTRLENGSDRKEMFTQRFAEDNYLCRFLRNVGMSWEQVSQETGIYVNTIRKRLGYQV